MIDKLIDTIVTRCFEKRTFAVVIAIVVAIFGYYSWTQMTIEAYPELTDVTAQVTTQVPGLAAEEIEQQITTPLERALASTPGVVTMRSSSTFGLSLITMVFRDGAEDYWSRARITERISGVTLPTGVTPSLDPVSGPAGEIYRYTLESDTKNLMQLSELQNWVVIAALMTVTGVANVDNFGGFTKEYQLEIDPKQLMRSPLRPIDSATRRPCCRHWVAAGGTRRITGILIPVTMDRAWPRTLRTDRGRGTQRASKKFCDYLDRSQEALIAPL
jgi:cobalt-zinc-cadmium resistance protein CzcA